MFEASPLDHAFSRLRHRFLPNRPQPSSRRASHVVSPSLKFCGSSLREFVPFRVVGGTRAVPVGLRRDGSGRRHVPRRRWWCGRSEQWRPTEWCGGRAVHRGTVRRRKSVGFQQPHDGNGVCGGTSGCGWPANATGPAGADRSNGARPPRRSASRTAASPTANSRPASTARPRGNGCRVHRQASRSHHGLQEIQFVRGEHGGFGRFAHSEVPVAMNGKNRNVWLGSALRRPQTSGCATPLGATKRGPQPHGFVDIGAVHCFVLPSTITRFNSGACSRKASATSLAIASAPLRLK